MERVLGQPDGGPSRPDRPLMGMGLESLDLLELRRSLSEALGVALDPTFFFRYGTPDAVVRYFSDQSVAEAAWCATAAGTAVRNRQEEVRGIEESGEGFAIVGLACRMPGAATDCAAFWDLLADQGDAVEEISAERWRLFAAAMFQSTTCRAKALCCGPSTSSTRRSSTSRRAKPRCLIRSSACCSRRYGTRWKTRAFVPDALAGSATGLFVGRHRPRL